MNEHGMSRGEKAEIMMMDVISPVHMDEGTTIYITGIDGARKIITEDYIDGICFHILDVRELIDFDGADIDMLDALAFIIDTWFSHGFSVVVHCQAGAERSPLVVAWYLHVKGYGSLLEIYERLERMRPCIMRTISILDGKTKYSWSKKKRN